MAKQGKGMAKQGKGTAKQGKGTTRQGLRITSKVKSEASRVIYLSFRPRKRPQQATNKSQGTKITSKAQIKEKP